MAEIIKISGGGSNCYLVTENGKSILIDTGMKGKRNAIVKALEGKNVTLIILTHGHIDHVQNAAYLSKKLNAPVAIHRLDIPLLKDNLCRPMKSKGFPGNLVRFFSEQSAKGVKLEDSKPSVFLKDGDSLKPYGIDATVIGLPGHTAGSIGILVGKNDFIVGDALMHMFTASASLLYEDREQMIQSAKRISKMGSRKIYFGHGAPVANKQWVKRLS
ncbi:MAG: MBL fold metallo-hydrolase [Lachnospiraceae bacterium]|nr:MBL fold metallo-hydrolase [Lachnospiraceae bacterium]